LTRSLRRTLDIAVDLGTANTLVYVTGQGILVSEPSVVAIDQVTRDVYAVGLEAKRMIGRTPATISAVRPLRHGVIADFEVTEQMLRYFLGRVHRSRFGHPRLVLCAPSGITDVERRALVEASSAAGASAVALIEEPLAAAIGSDLPVAEPSATMIVDIGGGTSEVAVISLGGIVCLESVRVGGYDLDEAIIKLLQDEQRLLIGQEQAEALKIEIGAALPGMEVPETGQVAGRDLRSGLLRRTEVESSAVQRALQRPLGLIIDAVKLVLERTPPELSADIADSGLMFVGGGALLPGFDQLLRRETGLSVTVADDPLTTVARGAGQALEELDHLTPSLRASYRRRRRRG
jgi:rod shape-determining protein MreB and related proteins